LKGLLVSPHLLDSSLKGLLVSPHLLDMQLGRFVS
jgi:hypothetical protein